ncbi:MAG: ABC transporter permease [Coriobacteriia bacterium]|nr:ABC transporter permease [Coriobacteriia bacterium]MCL2537736.1 ABC transporter permease [Coriobacteriia bacterium]
MNFYESFRIALKALGANKGRTFLTMLGVIIGVMSVILLVSIGTGVRKEVTGQLEGFGTNLIYAIPGNFEEMLGGGGGAMAMPSRQFNNDDVEAVRARVSGSGLVSPMVDGSGRLTLRNNTMFGSVSGVDGNIDEVFDITLAEGRAFNNSEVLSASRVAVIGNTVKTQLFGNRDALGEEFQVNDQRFRVVGVLEEQGGGGMGGSLDTTVYMPFTAAQRLFGNQDISMIAVKADDPEEISLVQSRIRTALQPRLGSDGFSVFTQDQMLNVMGSIMGMLTTMLAGLASISLLVGGIGIMNIMLVSVSERTREIGIRKAIGARTYDIMSQFVIESVLLSVLGGLVGIALGALGSWTIASTTAIPSAVSLWSVGLAFGFSLAVGIFFGVYPAWKASKLDPIEALRYE